MWNWIFIGGLYALGMGFFSVLGGVRAAGDAFQRWGETVARRDRCPSPSC